MEEAAENLMLRTLRLRSAFQQVCIPAQRDDIAPREDETVRDTGAVVDMRDQMLPFTGFAPLMCDGLEADYDVGSYNAYNEVVDDGLSRLIFKMKPNLGME
jgi:hypothetical protein